MRAVRLDDDAGGRQVAVALQQWLTASQEHFLGAADVTAADEQQAWRVLNQAVARALRS